MTPIAWLPWSAESFARARSEARPILLSIAPAWCAHSQEMDRTSFADKNVCALVGARFVPVRVDADRRPDVSARYGLGGWPTTAFLTSDGRVLGGGTFVEAARLADVLERVADAFASGRHLGRAIDAQARRGPAVAVPIRELVGQVLDTFDAEHGGFGDRPKFPHVAPIRLAISMYRETGSQKYYDIAVTSLDAMGWGPLYDAEHGGFFNYSHDVDWGSPNRAKLLNVNASLLSLYIEGLEVLRLARYGERAEDVLRYTQTWLADPLDGGWAASQRAGDDYYQRTDQAGSGDQAPPVDRTLFTDWNATMVSAALQAGRVLGDASLSEFAVKSLERILLMAYTPGSGLAHYLDNGTPHVRGLLDDHVAMSTASLDAFEATGNITYQMMAEELALYATRTMWDAEHDGFVDRVSDPRRDIGLLKERVYPFAANCLAARVLERVERTSGSIEYGDYSRRVLATMAPRAAGQGPCAAEFVLAAGHAESGDKLSLLE